MKILELKTRITKIKSVDGLKGRLDTAEKITESIKNRQKRRGKVRKDSKRHEVTHGRSDI